MSAFSVPDDFSDPDDTDQQLQEDYLPARMVNEFVYCPRLFYLMHVEGQFAESIDTIEGTIVHRRVDDGSGRLLPAESFIPAADEAPEVVEPTPTKPRSRKPKHVQPASLFGDDEEVIAETNESDHPDDEIEETSPKTIHARSVTLSSDVLGVIAKLDLAEARGDVATPVDYKRGRPKQMADGTAGAWDPERVQIALQALVLRENGYQSDAGMLYFNETRQRVRVPLDDQLLELTRRAVDGARSTRESGQIPPPLVDSPKCIRCSLVRICLPDETRHLASSRASANSKSAKPLANHTTAMSPVRPMITARDERRPLYFNTQGMWIGRQGEVLRAKVEGKIVQEVRINEINQVNLFGNIQLSTQAIQTLMGREIPVVYFTQRGYFYGVGGGIGAKNITVRREQFRRADDPTFCLDLARRLVRGKIGNHRTLLMRNHREPSADSLRQLKKYANRASTADSLATLLGIEGTAARIYFQNFAGMLKVDCSITGGGALDLKRPAFDFRGRNRRPPRDPVNAMLSLAYSLLTKDCQIAALTVGLDPQLGFYHQVKPGKPALALDLMEPFRPLIAESVVLSAINNRMVTPDHFILAGQSVVLSDTGRKHFLLAYEQRMDALVTHPLFDYRVSYRRLLEIQTRLLARLLTGEIVDYSVFQTR